MSKQVVNSRRPHHALQVRQDAPPPHPATHTYLESADIAQLAPLAAGHRLIQSLRNLPRPALRTGYQKLA